MQGNIGPLLEYSTKTDLKKMHKQIKTELTFRSKLENTLTIAKVSRKTIKSRNTGILSAIKKVKKSRHKKVEKIFSYPVA